MAARIIVIVLLGMLAGWEAVEAQSEVRVSVSRSGDVETRTEELASAQGSGAGPDPDLREINAGGRFLNMNNTSTTEKGTEVCMSIETEDGTPFPRRVVDGELVSAVSITNCVDEGTLLPAVDAAASERSCGPQMAEICFEWQTLVTDGCDGIQQTTILVRKFFDDEERGSPTRRVLVVNPVPLPPIVDIRLQDGPVAGGATLFVTEVPADQETTLVATDEKQCINREERIIAPVGEVPDWVTFVDQGVDLETGVGTTDIVMNPTADDVGQIQFTVGFSDGVDVEEKTILGEVVVGNSFELRAFVGDVRAAPGGVFSAMADVSLGNPGPESQAIQGWSIGFVGVGAANISSVQSLTSGLTDAANVAFEKTEVVDPALPGSGAVAAVVFEVNEALELPPGDTEILRLVLTGATPAMDGAATTGGLQSTPTFQDSEGNAFATELLLPGGVRVPVEAAATFSILADSSAPDARVVLEPISDEDGVTRVKWSVETNFPWVSFATFAQADDPANFPGIDLVPAEGFPPDSIVGGFIDPATDMRTYHVVGSAAEVVPAGKMELFTSKYFCENRKVAVRARIVLEVPDGTQVDTPTAMASLSCVTSRGENSCEGARRLGTLSLEESLEFLAELRSMDPGPERNCPEDESRARGGGGGNGAGPDDEDDETGDEEEREFQPIGDVYPTEESLLADVRARGVATVLADLLFLGASAEELTEAAWLAFRTESEFEPQFLITAEIDPSILDPGQQVFFEVQRLLGELALEGLIDCTMRACEENLETFSGRGAGGAEDLVPRFVWEAQPDTTYLVRLAGDLGTYPLVISAAPPGGPQVAGDCNQDGTLDVSDPLCMAEVLFLGARDFPCGDGGAGDPANLALLDLNGTGEGDPNFGIDLSDLISLVNFLFLGRAAPVQGVGCFAIAGCAENPGCAL